jgi:hypothetical protein
VRKERKIQRKRAKIRRKRVKREVKEAESIADKGSRAKKERERMQ